MQNHYTFFSPFETKDIYSYIYILYAWLAVICEKVNESGHAVLNSNLMKNKLSKKEKGDFCGCVCQWLLLFVIGRHID